MLPTGTVTFLFTDIEGSTRKWEQYPNLMQMALSRHDRLLEDAIHQHGGQVVKKRGDGYHAVFVTPQDAVSSALEAQRNLTLEEWDTAIGSLKVRMSLHTAAAKEREGDYYGSQLNRAARLEAAAHGGQILLSVATRELVKDDLPEDAYLLDLGKHRLKDLTRPEHIYQLKAIGIQDAFPPPRTLDAHRTNLPVISTSFIGRTRDLSEICELVSNPECRLLTLTGPGGIGKTRLSMQTAAEVIENFPDGVYFVPLAALQDAEFIVTTIADVFNFEIDAHSNLDPKTQLLDYLSLRTLLLVLDNFEHLVEGSQLLVEMLACSPGIKLLVTSRERLNLQGEWTYEVTGLSYPDNGKISGIEEYSAVRLFIERARQIESHFSMQDDDRQAIKRICQLMEGMPLGIELAAAWIAVLTPREILDEIEKNIDFLASKRRDLPEKHRSIRAVFDYSWDMLTDGQRSGYMRLSVFRGGFTREASDSVADVSLLHLSDFVNKSMLRRSTQGRYYLHEMLRSYAAEMLAASPEEYRNVYDRHSLFYLGYLDDRVAELQGDRLKELREEIRQEIENMRAAMSWIAVNWEPDQAREAMLAYLHFYEVQGFHEGVEVFNRLCEYIEHDRESDTAVLLQEDPVYLTTRIYEAYFLCELGQIDRAEQICDDCLPGLLSLDMQIELVYGYLCLGIIPLYQGNYNKSRAYLNESIEYGKVTHSYEMVGALNLWLGWVYYMLKETELALAKFQESYEIFKVHKNNWGLGFALSKLGLIYDDMKDYQRAMKAYLDAREIFAGFGDLAGDAYTTSRMCMTVYGMGDYEEAIRLGEIGLERFTEIGHRWGMAVSLCRIGFPYLATGNLSEAERCFSKALARGLELQMEPLCIYALIGTACVDVARGDDTRAADLYVFAREHPSTTPVYMDQAERWFDELKTRLTEDEFAAAESRLEGRDLEEITRNVLGERINQG